MYSVGPRMKDKAHSTRNLKDSASKHGRRKSVARNHSKAPREGNLLGRGLRGGAEKIHHVVKKEAHRLLVKKKTRRSRRGCKRPG